MTSDIPEQPTSAPVEAEPIPFVRLTITGAFMGLANLVPGVSGGTMVLALGLYEDFIGAMASITKFKVTKRAIVVLAMLFGISFVTIFALSSVIQFLMEMFKPGMLALFIGMTLGGAPMLFKDMKPLQSLQIFFTLLGIGVMALVAFVLKPDTTDPNFVLYFLGGIIGSSAMILPGISGSYLLLVLGLYLPIIGGISDMKDALSARDISLFMNRSLTMAMPVGLGLVAGLVFFSNFLKFMMDRYHKPTIGFLLGLLLGSVLGLYPFQTATFEKLPRHAEVLPDGNRDLRIYGFGFSEGPLVDQLEALTNDTTQVQFLEFNATATPTAEDVARARASNAVIVAYDVNVPRDVRRLAEEKIDDRRVELVIVPNAEFTIGKLILVIFLVIFGAALTLFLGSCGKKKDSPRHAVA